MRCKMRMDESRAKPQNRWQLAVKQIKQESAMRLPSVRDSPVPSPVMRPKHFVARARLA